MEESVGKLENVRVTIDFVLCMYVYMDLMQTFPNGLRYWIHSFDRYLLLCYYLFCILTACPFILR